MGTFAFTVDAQYVQGDKRVHEGTFTSSAGATGGDITTGLSLVQFMELQQNGSVVVGDEPVVYEVLPIRSAVTIVTTANVTGWWKAIGR
jgi:hypothetical protein